LIGHKGSVIWSEFGDSQSDLISLVEQNLR